jgi:chemotaxis signal transduction protein
MLILQDEVKEVLPFVKMAEIRSSELRISGFSSFKGELLPVIDLNDLPALIEKLQTTEPHFEANANARVLVIQVNEQLVGVKVDAVLGIQHYWLNAQEVDHSDSSWFQAWLTLDDGDQMTERLPVLNIQGIAKYCRMETDQASHLDTNKVTMIEPS